MLKWQYDNNFSFFILDNSGIKIAVDKWLELQNSYLSEFSILNEFIDNGLAMLTSHTCEVAASEVFQLSDIDKLILSLPDLYPYEIYIQSDGTLNQSSFRFKYGFYDFTPNGSRLAARRNGPLIEIEDRQYLLSEAQYFICESVDEFNSLPEKDRTFPNNLKRFAEIKDLSKTAASFLDKYLEKENVYQADKITIDLSFENGTLEITPNIGFENRGGFLKSFDQFNSVRDVYNVTDNDGNTVRIPIDEKQKKVFARLKEVRRKTDKDEIDKIVAHPEQLFDEEIIDDSIIDISAFYSDRVIEIGLYKPKFYPFVCPYKSEWIPGLKINDNTGTKIIHFKNPVELSEFEHELHNAQKSGLDSFTWKDQVIPNEEAEKFIRIANKQFENPTEAYQHTEVLREDKVLIIKENSEVLEHSDLKYHPDNIVHTFYDIPNLVKSIQLKAHQKEGIAWLQNLHNESFSGCLLADDMGLGKTLQLLYFIEWHSQNKNDSKPYLIVAPVSLLENWENEYKRFFSPQKLSMITINSEFGLQKQYNNVDTDTLQRKQIILTNYETLRIYQLNLGSIDFAVVVLDEAQKIKTPGTLVTSACKALKADFKIAMTGTPVENTLVDLWCIMDFSVSGLLGTTKDFAKEFQNPLKNSDTDVKELCETLRNKIGIFIKHRLKADVAKDLPLKHDNAQSRIAKQMPVVQLERYKVELEKAKNTNLESENRGALILKSLQAIRDISDHPYLADKQVLSYPSNELVATSAKLQILLDILEKIRSKDEKAIVFADRKDTQKMLQKIIYEYYRVSSSIINGDTPSTKQDEGKTKLSRQQTIDRYQSIAGFNVIIMSPIAAGVGLNVTGANHIIHYSRHWNPAKEEQATDRAYRIGQQKDVHVYYPMAIADDFRSFDLILDELLARKKALAASTLYPTEQIELKLDETYSSVFGLHTEGNTEGQVLPLSISDIYSLQPLLFEAYIAALYSKKGFITHLTPNSNDKGVDVIAFKDGENYLIQAKQSKSLIGNNGVQEIAAAKNYFDKKFGIDFKLILLSNNDFTSAAELLAKPNRINLVNRLLLEKMIADNGVTIQDVHKCEAMRMKII